MATIKIDDIWSLTSDRDQWILLELINGTNPKTKEPTQTTRKRYYPTLSQALSSYADMSLRVFDDWKSLTEHLGLLTDILEGVRRLVLDDEKSFGKLRGELRREVKRESSNRC